MRRVIKLPAFTMIAGNLLCCIAMLFSVSGFANTYIPNTFTDPVITTLNNATGQINGGTTISLRSALQAADNLGGTHTITLSTGTYNLTQALPNRELTIGNTNQNITINGNGPANTIINMVNDANKDRILLINPVGTTNSPVITISGITFQNGFVASDAFGGAGIYAGGGSAESLTVTNCAFLNNTTPANNGGGAAIKMDVRGNLTVDNCTFTNNVSNDADGGAILNIVYNSGVGTGFGTCIITNSTFTGNSVNFPGAGNANGGAIAVSGQSGVSTFNATINNNTFINNSADGLGGAIVANNSPVLSTLQIHFNRFVGNTAAAGANSSALHYVNTAGPGLVNADNNWWGCNSNPVTGPSSCDRAGPNPQLPGLILTKWLQLKTTAATNPICNSTPTTLGNTSGITTSFLSNSASEAVTVANISRLIGLPVTWTSTLGNLSSQQATIQAAGTATATFTSNGTAGTATVNAQVDNVPAAETTPARASITVNLTSAAPTGATGTTTICNGSSTTLTVTGGTKGTGASTQWFTGSCGGTLVFTGDAFTTSPAATTSYFVRYNGTCNATSCATVTVTVNNPSAPPSAITGTTTICNGSSTTLTATGGTLGTGANYQWGTGAVVGTSPLAGQTASTLTVSPVANTTYWVRIENTTAPCTANTGGVTQLVTVNQPSVAPTGISGTTTICNGGSTTLTATGGTLGTGANYQWGTGSVVGTSPLAGQTASTLNVSPTTNTTYWVRIENTTAPCTAITGGVTQLVTVNQPSVAPTGISGTTTICSGSSTTLTATGGTLGTGANYQWGTGSVVGTSPLAGQTALTLNVSPAGTTTYWVRIENTAAPCTGITGGVTKIVTVSANNTINLSSGAGTNNQSVTVLTPISTITWNTTGATGATFTSLPPGVNGNWAANVATVSGTPNTTGSYIYSVNLTGGCNGGSAGGTINVTAPIPVKLTSFTGQLNADKTVLLQWKVEEQQGIIQYEVEKSRDASLFTQIGIVPAGTSLSQSYSFLDKQPVEGNNFYRLKIIELSGKINYSNIVSVKVNPVFTVKVYPIPVKDKLVIEQTGTVHYHTAAIYDGQGKQLQQLNLINLRQEVNVATLAAGIYFIKTEDGQVIKLIKQ